MDYTSSLEAVRKARTAAPSAEHLAAVEQAKIDGPRKVAAIRAKHAAPSVTLAVGRTSPQRVDTAARIGQSLPQHHRRTARRG